MKKLIIALVSVFALASCNPPKEGDINIQPQTIYMVGGKQYKAVNVQVSDGSDVWLFLPLDSLTVVPISIHEKIPGTDETPDIKQNIVIIK